MVKYTHQQKLHIILKYQARVFENQKNSAFYILQRATCTKIEDEMQIQVAAHSM